MLGETARVEPVVVPRPWLGFEPENCQVCEGFGLSDADTRRTAWRPDSGPRARAAEFRSDRKAAAMIAIDADKTCRYP